MAARKTPESYVLQACRDYLELMGWDVTRMNSGAVQDKRGIPVRMHSPGTADLLAMREAPFAVSGGPIVHIVCWVECKAANGRQSDKQLMFQRRKENLGQKYVLAYEIDDLIKAGL